MLEGAFYVFTTFSTDQIICNNDLLYVSILIFILRN